MRGAGANALRFEGVADLALCRSKPLNCLTPPDLGALPGRDGLKSEPVGGGQLTR